LVELARQRRLPPSATGGSIATVTNFGTFGLTWATPIPLPEQTLVLGMGAGRAVPNWDAAQKQFVPVTEANLTLSFDHRVLDGGGAGRLLARIAALLAKPAEL
ncbi:MAG TPA: 2-oxo acid dehydrogenase subunit E2, partial [Chthoniobacteraceae bacterium]|nr:2-oxo acid dehydrogenase subunit E2 [Chthoniobacteraceae bacterium]